MRRLPSIDDPEPPAGEVLDMAAVERAAEHLREGARLRRPRFNASATPPAETYISTCSTCSTCRHWSPNDAPTRGGTDPRRRCARLSSPAPTDDDRRTRPVLIVPLIPGGTGRVVAYTAPGWRCDDWSGRE